MKKTHRFVGLIPPSLLRVIREGKCVLFVGAGVSAQAVTEDGEHLPTWGQLLEKMVEWCADNRIDLRAEKAEFLEIIGKKRYLTVAQELQERLGPRLNVCLSDILHAGRIRPSEAHGLIPQTDWVAVLTSNYDSLIEGAYAMRMCGVLPPVFSQGSVGSALNCLRNDRHFVFKVHGDVNVPGSIVLGNRDYSRLLYSSPAYRSFLETIFATYTVLFVGFGGDDPDLNDVTDRLSTVYERSIGQHYLLVPDDAFSSIERRRLLEDKRLDCITYQKDDSHSQVVEFLRAIATRTEPDAPAPPSPFKPDRASPRMFISGSFKQAELLRELAYIAKEQGFDVWYAESQIVAGELVQDVISEAIADTDCMLVVLTEEAAKSPWVHFELGRAWAARKRILPIRVGDAPVPSDIANIAYLQVSSPKLTDQDRARITQALGRFLAETRNRDYQAPNSPL